ncbi:MAG: hypothetical protein AB7I30_07825 [Isosphaeraceae bacterium]
MRPQTRPRLLGLLLITTIVTVAPACQATAGGGPKGDGLGLKQRLSNRFAYRPAYPYPNPVPRTRPLYLSGYAGARYGPTRTLAPISPTAAVVPVEPLPYWVPTAPGIRGLLGLEPATPGY